MNYLAPLALETSLSSLRENYQRNAKVSFNDPQPTSYGMYYGYKDIELRNKQTKLIEAFSSIPLPNNSNEDKAAYIEKTRLMVAVCYLIQQKIIAKNTITPVGSELNKLLSEALDISENNQLDTLTLQNCLLVLETFDIKRINAISKKTILSPVEWNELRSFAQTTRMNLKPNTDSALTTNLSFAAGIFFQPMGWGFGFALGQTFGRAGQTGAFKKALTNTLTSGLVLLAPLTGTTAAAATFFGRPHAEQAVEYASAYATAQFIGYGFKKFGQCTGWVIGKSLEVAYDTTTKLGKKAYNWIIAPEQIAELDIHIGIDLVNEDIFSKSKTLSQAQVIERVQEIIKENQVDVPTSATCSHAKEHVLQFKLSEQEQQLLPRVLDVFGYNQQQLSTQDFLAYEERDEEEQSITTVCKSI